MLRSVGPRPVVRALLLHDEYPDDDAVKAALTVYRRRRSVPAQRRLTCAVDAPPLGILSKCC
jgi:hypothetical protein